ncbi:MAG: 4-hydroxythreonine-4-phosphate dehydrogenase PdxA [Opitutales bacterium]|nr:4-hydroxythreonine-4-phosphate dehydrogenase PdxA [Opitutales bacterium]
MSKPRIAITMGDPAGIGPEICLDLLNDPEISDLCSPIVFGDSSVLQSCAEKTNKSFDYIEISENQIKDTSKNGIFDLGLMNLDQLNPGTADANTGRATYGYITSAIDACLVNKVDAVVTCPANKEALQAGGVSHPGHTEIFAELTSTEKFCMAFFSDEISCSLVTVHCGYSEVPALLSVDRIYDVISLTRKAHQKLLGREPRLAICGLNPHGGENGLFGNLEEEKLIIPAIEKAKDEGMQLIGPLPPDTAFTPSIRKSIDAYVCMYHDQGLIPVKALAFEEAVNVTLGLPIIRTSVDHGTALDIAWQGKADPSSLKSAVRLAIRMCS